MAGSILIVTEDEALLDDLLRLCAAAGAEAEVVHSLPAPVPLPARAPGLRTGPPPAPAPVRSAGAGHGPGEHSAGVPGVSGGVPIARRDAAEATCAQEATAGAAAREFGRAAWDSAPLVLVGDDRVTRLSAVARRPGVLLIGRDLDDHGVWERAVRIGAEQVLLLPDDEPRLADRIADAAEGVGRQALTVGVISGRGGAGASTLACALALTAARRGERTMLIDGDPLGGGLDVLLGGETAEGLRWPAFADSCGRVGGAALEESLPRLHNISVLSWDRGESVAIPAEAMRSVLAAARRRGGVVVIDLPRRLDESVNEALGQLDIGLLVVPAELRAVAAAHRVASRVGMVLRDLRAVVRGSRSSALDDEEIARLLGLPLAGEVPMEHGLSEAVDIGTPPAAGGRGPLARFCTEFWSRALPGEGGAAS